MNAQEKLDSLPQMPAALREFAQQLIRGTQKQKLKNQALKSALGRILVSEAKLMNAVEKLKQEALDVKFANLRVEEYEVEGDRRWRVINNLGHELLAYQEGGQTFYGWGSRRGHRWRTKPEAEAAARLAPMWKKPKPPAGYCS